MRNHREEQGGAAVELAILMLIIVPVLLYTLMINDLMRHRLDLQEAVTTSAWDYTTLNYNGLSTNQVKTANQTLQAIWCDHSGVIDGDDPQADCDSSNGDDTYHKGQVVAAHGCWKASDAQIVSCNIETNFRQNALNPTGIDIIFNRARSFQTGGRVVCNASLAVYNNLIPKEFLTQWSEVDMTDKDRQEGPQLQSGADLHDNTGDPHWTYRYSYALQTDTWAIHAGRAHDGGRYKNSNETSHSGRRGGDVRDSDQDHTQFKRSKHIHDNPLLIGPAALATTAFFATAYQNRIFFPALHPMGASIPGVFEMTARPQPETHNRPDGNNYYSTPYRYIDTNNSHYDRVYQDRNGGGNNVRGYYLGCRQPAWGGGCNNG